MWGPPSTRISAAGERQGEETVEQTMQRKRGLRLNALHAAKRLPIFLEAASLVQRGIAENVPAHAYEQSLGLGGLDGHVSKRTWERSFQDWTRELQTFVNRYRQPEEVQDLPKPPGMLVSVAACSGRKLAVVEADASWRLDDVLGAIPEPEWPTGHRLRVFLGQEELCGNATLGTIGAESGSELTIVVTKAFRIATCCGHRVKILSAHSGECLCALGGHQDYVNTAIFSPVGRELLTASADRTAKIWSTASGECVLTLEGHHDEVNSAAFSPDGKELLTASVDRTAKVWSAASGECLHTLEGHRAEVMSAIFSPDGQQFMTASADWTAKVWSTTSRDCLRTLHGHNDEVNSVAFSPDGQELLTASQDHTAKVWSAASGECLRTLEGHHDEVMSAIFSPDGKQVVTASADLTVKAWSATSGECLRTLGGHQSKVWSVWFSPDGQELVTASADRTVKLWSASSGECLHTLEDAGSSACFAP